MIYLMMLHSYSSSSENIKFSRIWEKPLSPEHPCLHLALKFHLAMALFWGIGSISANLHT